MNLLLTQVPKIGPFLSSMDDDGLRVRVHNKVKIAHSHNILTKKKGHFILLIGRMW